MKLIDLHCDTAYRMHRNLSTLAKNDFHISLDKISDYQNYGQLMAIFISNKLSDDEGYYRFGEVYGYYLSQIASNTDKVEFLTDGSKLQSAWDSGKTALYLSVEDARILNNDIDRLAVLYKKGVRSLVFMWSGETCIGGSHNTSVGLSEFGRLVAQKCFELGIVPDISHASEQTAEDMINIAISVGKPLIASHSNAYTVYNHSRNLRDKHFEAIRDMGGLVGLSLCRSHLSGDDNVGVDAIMKHIDHYLSLGGENTLSLGCDLDGTDLPDGFCDVRDVTKIADSMAKNNYSDELINKVFWGNAKLFFENYIH